MTRINCIDPALLSDKHLGAEYRARGRAVNYGNPSSLAEGPADQSLNIERINQRGGLRA